MPPKGVATEAAAASDAANSVPQPLQKRAAPARCRPQVAQKFMVTFYLMDFSIGAIGIKIKEIHGATG